MTFAAPAFLLLLLLVPLAGIVYAIGERRRARGRAAFASPALVPSVAPRPPAWRRHVPSALYALALATLIVALARPQTTVAVAVQRATIVLVFDHSGSMRARDVVPTRLDAAREAGGRFLATVPAQVRVGAVGFSSEARAIQGPTLDRDAVRRGLAGIQARGRTAMGEGLDLALQMARVPATPGRRPPPAAIILLSDGYSDVGRNPVVIARQARRAGVPVYTVSLGTADGTIQVGPKVVPVPPDPAAMRAIAAAGGGQSFAVQDSRRLDAVYKRLGAQVSHVRRPRQQTAAFAGGALAVLVAAGLLSLRWFGRLP